MKLLEDAYFEEPEKAPAFVEVIEEKRKATEKQKADEYKVRVWMRREGIREMAGSMKNGAFFRVRDDVNALIVHFSSPYSSEIRVPSGHDAFLRVVDAVLYRTQLLQNVTITERCEPTSMKDAIGRLSLVDEPRAVQEQPLTMEQPKKPVEPTKKAPVLGVDV